MLRKQLMIAFLVLMLALILSSCSSDLRNSAIPQNDVLNNDVLNNDLAMTDNCIVRTNIKYKNMEVAFKDVNRKLLRIKKFYLDFRSKDLRGLTDLLAKDVVFLVAGKPGLVPLAGKYNGKEEVKGYLKGWYSSYSQIQMIFQFNLVSGNLINTHTQIIARVPSTGKTLDIELVYSWVLNNEGKIKSLSLFYDTFSWWKAFQPGGDTYIEDFKGTMNFDIHPISYDSEQIIKDAYAAYKAGNLPGLMDMLDDNFVFILKGDKNCVYPAIYPGKASFIQFATNLFGVASYTQPLTCKYYIVQGNRVDYHAYEELICRATGKAFVSNLVHSLIIGDDGKLVEFKSYNDSFDVYQAFQP